jgi:hypothetical protein
MIKGVMVLVLKRILGKKNSASYIQSWMRTRKLEVYGDAYFYDPCLSTFSELFIQDSESFLS